MTPNPGVIDVPPKYSFGFLILLVAAGCDTENAVIHSNDCVNLFQEQDYRLALEAGRGLYTLTPTTSPPKFVSDASAEN